LYSIRDYASTDSARFVDWKASARSGGLKVREFTREDERRVMLVLDPHVAGDTRATGDAALLEQFERAVKLCACVAWHFYEIDSEMQFRTPTLATPMAPAGEIIYEVMRDLAFVQMQPGGGENFLMALAEEPEVFKVVITSQPRGSIPTSLWTSSYFVFMQSL
jgi:uncharacterized protein (DUF58 family)